MVYISKVYTKFGDQGDTMLASGDTVGKDTARVSLFPDPNVIMRFHRGSIKID